MVGTFSDGMIGDLTANIEKLKGYLRQARFPVHRLDIEGLRSGRPAAVLPILHYIFLGFSVLFSKFLSERGHELHAKSDLRFLEAAYRALRENLGYSPALSTAQFFSNGFAERKVLLCQDVLQLARRKHSELMSSSSAQPHRRPERRAGAGALATELLSSVPGLDVEPHVEVLRDSLEVSARPQTPPKPCPMESAHPEPANTVMLEAYATMGCQEPQTIGATAPLQSPCVLSSPAPTGELEVLHGLLEGIRTALNRRFDTLERRFEAYVEEADARAALLQGEVKILTSRLQEASRVQEALKDQSPDCGSHPSEARTLEPKTTMPPERSLAAPFRQVNLQSNLLNSCWSPGVAVDGAGILQAHLEKSLESPEVQRGGAVGAAADAPALSGESWTRLQEHAKSEFVDRDTHVLIEQLSCKFRDTQELINRAQEKMQQVGISTQGVKDDMESGFAVRQRAPTNTHGGVRSRSVVEEQSIVDMNSMQLQKDDVTPRWQALWAQPRGIAETLVG
mmetsp:Transcript_108096/g.187581  ORF Transcript_108096/g.187581 Transcript_108096/m.187581 type:complete len:509 (-) Transcript_108096:55-1581(-)